MKSDDEVVNRTWERMGRWQDEEPGPAVRARFYQMLEAYEAGRRERRERFSWAWFRWPAAVAACAACLLVGIFAGRQSGGGSDVATLKTEVQSMRQLVALSLMQQQSAVDRLRGVTWSYRVQPSDTEVLSALLEAINHDDAVNVRLAAADALRRFRGSPVAQRGVVQSLSRQDSPLVQAALLDLIVEMKAPGAAAEVRRIASDSNADPGVREHARGIASQLGYATY
jgi:hypothetical protein